MARDFRAGIAAAPVLVEEDPEEAIRELRHLAGLLEPSLERVNRALGLLSGGVAAGAQRGLAGRSR